MSDFDLAAYLDIFKEDVGEHLERMSAGLLALEANPADGQPIDDLFRSAHTIKGSARMMGLESIATLAHRMEDLFSAFRSGQVVPSIEHVSLLLQALDELRELVDRSGVGGPQDGDSLPTVSALEAVLHAQAENGGFDRGGEESHLAEIAVAEERGADVAPHEPGGGATVRQREFLRVSVGKVDTVLNLAGALAIRRGDGRRQFDLLRGVASQVEDIGRFLDRGDEIGARFQVKRLAQQLHQLARSQRAETVLRSEMLADLHAELTRMRMLPLSTVMGVFQRVLRDLAVSTGKEVQLVVEGAETEMDKLILEGIQEPLLHLVRNALDHGIEPPEVRASRGKARTGTVRIVASQLGDRVEIAVEDDGAGIDLDRIRQKAVARGLLSEHQARDTTADELIFLVFVPGFTTRDEVTELSGRGVGMDAVRAAVAELDGHVTVQTRIGSGTRVLISLPLTLAYARVLLVIEDGQMFGIPAASVDSVYEVPGSSVSWLQGRAAVQLTGRTLPLVGLANALSLDVRPWSPPEVQPIVVCRSGAQRVAFAVERLVGEETIVSKTLGPFLQAGGMVTGGAILADGRVALLLNVTSLIDAALQGEMRRPAMVQMETEATRTRVLVVDDTAITRELERAILLAAGYEVETAVDGMEALEKLSTAPFDAVITDVEMPRLDGFELTRTIRRDERLRELPIVIVTTRESQADRRRGLEAGAQAYLLKGAFDQDNLLETLHRLVG